MELESETIESIVFETEEIAIESDNGTEFTITVEVFEDDYGDSFYAYHSEKSRFDPATDGTFEEIYQRLEYIEEFYRAFDDSGFEFADWGGDEYHIFQKEVDE